MLNKYITTGKVGAWFVATVQTKNFLTSKTFWLALVTNIVLLGTAWGVDSQVIQDGANIATGIINMVFAMWVRKHTTETFGDPIKSEPSDPFGDEWD